MPQLQSPHFAASPHPFRVSNHQPATRQLGDWELLELTATTEMSEIYRARPVGADGDQSGAYAVKTLRRSWERESWAVVLMRREAVVGRRTASAHVVAVLSASVMEPPYYLVMPWLSGTTLKVRLAAWPLVPVHWALWIIRQAAAGLTALHTQGWIHGDLKPENIFISPEGHVTLLDLGFARRPGEATPALDGCLLGTAGYLAPEAFVRRLQLDVRSDIYSLGIVLYEMLAGRPPFSGDTLRDLARQHRETTPARLDGVAPHVAPEVAALVHRMLAKDPLRRPQSPVELIDVLIGLEVMALHQWTAG